MKTLTILLTRLSQQLDVLTDAVGQISRQAAAQKNDLEHTRQELARMSLDVTWDINMLRQELASKQNLRNLAGQLASRQNLVRTLKLLCDRLDGLRFNSHREHQELLRYMDEGPYAGKAAAGQPAPADTDRTHPSHRSSTLNLNEVLELEDVKGVVERSPVPVAA